MSKKIKISNGEIRIGYEYNEPPKPIQDKIINEFIQFEIENINTTIEAGEEHPLSYLVDEMKRLNTPWFLGEVIWEKESKYILDIIKINEYLFDEDGVILPITRHYSGNKLIKTTYGSKEYNCIITDSEMKHCSDFCV